VLSRTHKLSSLLAVVSYSHKRRFCSSGAVGILTISFHFWRWYHISKTQILFVLCYHFLTNSGSHESVIPYSHKRRFCSSGAVVFSQSEFTSGGVIIFSQTQGLFILCYNFLTISGFFLLVLKFSRKLRFALQRWTLFCQSLSFD
jgi:hypothetical protein